jgi:hypothetical protein
LALHARKRSGKIISCHRKVAIEISDIRFDDGANVREWPLVRVGELALSTLSRHRRKTKATIHRKGEKMEAAVRDAK